VFDRTAAVMRASQTAAPLLDGRSITHCTADAAPRQMLIVIILFSSRRPQGVALGTGHGAGIRQAMTSRAGGAR